jgi:Zn-dependent protease with chaperone function
VAAVARALSSDGLIALEFNRLLPHFSTDAAACAAWTHKTMLKRLALFLATNLAVLALVSVVMSILGVRADQFGGLLVMAALFGFGGSIISLLMSKWVAKRFTGAHVIEQPRNEAE